MAIESIDTKKNEMSILCGNCGQVFTEKIKTDWTSRWVPEAGGFQSYPCDPCPNCQAFVLLNMDMPDMAEVDRQVERDKKRIAESLGGAVVARDKKYKNEHGKADKKEKALAWLDRHRNHAANVHELIGLVREDKKGAKKK